MEVALCLVELRGFEPLTPCMPSRDQGGQAMLVTLSALVISWIGIDRCGPLMTVVVPWAILQISPKPSERSERSDELL